MVIILLSTYNGERFLEEQLQSLVSQCDVEFRIIVRDDGSTDGTINILNKWQQKGLLEWYSGSNLKPARSFFNLLFNAPEAEFYAFCDQDDVWREDKLSVAIKKLSNKGEAAMYYGQIQLVDENLKFMKTELIHPKNNDIVQALVNNTATGCTVVINRPLKLLLKSYIPQYISMHDSWCLLVCIATGGIVYFDNNPHILYRQHCNNVIGLNKGWKVDWKRRLNKSILRQTCERSLVAKELLLGYGKYMNKSNYDFVRLAAQYRESFLFKLKLLFRSHINATSLKNEIYFRLAVLFNRY